MKTDNAKPTSFTEIKTTEYTNEEIQKNILKEQRIFIVFIPLLVLACVVWAFVFDDSEYALRFDLISAILGVIPLIPVMLIWWGQRKREWEEKLPQYLTVTLAHKKQNLAKVEYIPHQKGADVRSQAQTTLRNLFNENVHYLETFIRSENLKKEVCVDNDHIIGKGKPFQHISITIYLTKLHEKESQWEDNIPSSDDTIWFWSPLSQNQTYTDGFKSYSESPNHVPREPKKKAKRNA